MVEEKMINRMLDLEAFSRNTWMNPPKNRGTEAH
jgi:hypothetical protein